MRLSELNKWAQDVTFWDTCSLSKQIRLHPVTLAVFIEFSLLYGHYYLT